MKQIRFNLDKTEGRADFAVYCENIVRDNWSYALESVRSNQDVSELADYLETCIEDGVHNDGESARKSLEYAIKQRLS